MSETIERVVKQHHIFKGKRAGQVVLCSAEELEHASAKLATMSLEEYAVSGQPAPAVFAVQGGPTSVELARKHTEAAAAEYKREKAREAHQAKAEAEKAEAEAEKAEKVASAAAERVESAKPKRGK